MHAIHFLKRAAAAVVLLAGLVTCLACLIAGLLCAQTVPSQKHPFNTDDWAALHYAAPAALSPDGNSILYRVFFGAARGGDKHEWHTMSFDGSNQKHLELPDGFEPFGFTSDGAALYGAYAVNRVRQFAVFELGSLNAHSVPKVTVFLPRGMNGAAPSPDGSRYALLADPRAPDTDADTRIVIEPNETSIYVVNRDGSGGTWWCSDLKNIANAATAGGSSPAIAWSADASVLATVSMAPKIGNHDKRSWIDLCSSSGSKRVAEIPNAVSGIAWTAEGRKLAFLSTSNSVLTPDEVYTIALAGGGPVNATPNLNGTVLALTNDASGRVWTVVQRGLRAQVEEFIDNALEHPRAWPAGSVQTLPVFSPYRKGTERLVFTVNDPTHPPNIAVEVNGELKTITHLGDEELGRVSLGPVRTVRWTNKEGGPLEGIVTFPATYTQGARCPYVIIPHGGPEANDSLKFDVFARLIAGMGYVVMQPEYRGSTGYGDQFLEAIYQHIGDRAYQDVESATDYAIAMGWADPNRLAILGWSGGGFMASWAVTQTDRYRAAVDGAGVTDWSSFMWTSDILQTDYDARWPAKNPEAFHKFSPVYFVENVKTPILVLHGGADRRVPTYQGREYFEALRAYGKITRMVEFPGAPHFPVLWEQRRKLVEEMQDWLKKYNPVEGL